MSVGAVEKLVTPGQLLQAGITPCFTVADLSQVWVTANIYDSDLSLIEQEDPAEIVSSAFSTNLPGKVGRELYDIFFADAFDALAPGGRQVQRTCQRKLCSSDASTATAVKPGLCRKRRNA